MMTMSCDYLVVGGGATGMAFVDTLLNHYHNSSTSTSSSPQSLSVIMVDKHPTPGGQWHDSYKFVRLHQPSSMYGVETMKLEPTPYDNNNSNKTHRATRMEILDYYQTVREKLTKNYNFQYMGNTYCDLDNIIIISNNDSHDDVISQVTLKTMNNSDENTVITTMNVRKRIVDARYLEPDLPIFVKPKVHIIIRFLLDINLWKK